MSTDSTKAQVQLAQQQGEFPLLNPTLGHPVMDIKSFTQQLGAFTLDEGLRATAFCKSKITFIDGAQGILLHRGYPIDQLASQCSYTDVCYLLLHGDLPTTAQQQQFSQLLQEQSQLPATTPLIFQGFARDAHPMPMLIASMASLAAATQPDSTRDLDAQRYHAAIKLVASMPRLTAMCYRHHIDAPFIASRPEFSYAENFLHMLFAERDDAAAPDPILSQAMDHIFTLHADHEQNASTATVRLAGSTDANPFACIAAGIAALWGAKHGGANEAALRMLEEIGDEKHIEKYLAKAKDPNDPFRLMGFGHRVYKNYDPRAKVMQQTCHRVLQATGRGDNPLFKLAIKLEKIAAEDEYFVSRKLYPNIDFYSGITLNAMGIPTRLFTPIFALARSVGWISNWIEMHNDPDQGLIRPRQLYTGPAAREVDDKANS